MKNKINLLLVLIVLLPSVYGVTSFNYLTKGWADTLYCSIGGDCSVSSLNVGNLTVNNTVFFNISSFNVTGDLNITGCINYPDGSSICPGLNLSNATIAGDFTVLGTTELNGNFSTTCLHCEDGNVYFHNNGYFAGNVTAPNIEIMERLIVHGNSTCTGTANDCNDAMFVDSPLLCGLTIYSGQRGCRWQWSTGTCIGTATTCDAMSTATCEEQHTCSLTSNVGFIFGADGLVGNLSIEGNLNVSGNITANDQFYGNINSNYILSEHWVNESGDTMTGNLNMDFFNVTGLTQITVNQSIWLNGTLTNGVNSLTVLQAYEAYLHSQSGHNYLLKNQSDTSTGTITATGFNIVPAGNGVMNIGTGSGTYDGSICFKDYTTSKYYIGWDDSASDVLYMGTGCTVGSSSIWYYIPLTGLMHIIAHLSVDYIYGGWNNFESGDASPSVAKGNRFKTAGTTNIVQFDDGDDGLEIQIMCTGTITIENHGTSGGNIYTEGGSDISCASGYMVRFINQRGNWHQNTPMVKTS